MLLAKQNNKNKFKNMIWTRQKYSDWEKKNTFGKSSITTLHDHCHSKTKGKTKNYHCSSHKHEEFAMDLAS